MMFSDFIVAYFFLASVSIMIVQNNPIKGCHENFIRELKQMAIQRNVCLDNDDFI
jgi:hypothetical protein